MKTYDVINLGNATGEDGEPHIDSAHYTGSQVSLANPTLDDAIQALQEIGALNDRATTDTVERFEDAIGTLDSDSITLREKATGLFLFELRPAN